MHAGLAECRGRLLPAAVTLPALREGRVRACLGTMFTEAVPDPAAPGAETGAFAYPAGNALAAWKAGQRQLRLYHAWAQAGLIELLRPRASVVPERPGATPPVTAASPLRVGILMECADPIETPEQLPEWAEAGVVAIGMAWVHQSRYAAGNGVDPREPAGLTDLGRELARGMDRLGVVHDISHLSQRAVEQLFELTHRPVMASHSNCRALMGAHDDPRAQRHLADATIREIARRGGVIGINLLSDFLDPSITRGQRCTLDALIAHIEHACSVVGDRRHVGLGTDMDGGFAADRLPLGIDTHADLTRLFEALRSRSWSDADCAGLAHANWERFWSE